MDEWSVSERRTEDGHAAQADDLRRDHDQQGDAQSERQQARLRHQHRREQRRRQQVVALHHQVSLITSASLMRVIIQSVA